MTLDFAQTLIRSEDLSKGASEILTKRRRWLGGLVLTGWMIWAYARLLPRAPVLTSLGRLRNYHDWAYARLAYADILALYHTRHLYLHLVPYLQNRIEYPVLMGLFMWLASFAPGVIGYFTVTAIVLWLCAMGTYLLLERESPKYAMLFAISPMLLVYSLLNWDLGGIFLMVAAWRLYRKQQWTASGVVFALGVFFKLFPVFYLPFITVELIRQRRLGQWIKMLVSFLVTSAVVNVPFMIGNFKNWAYFFTFNAGRGLGADIWANRWVHIHSIRLVNDVSLMVVTVMVLVMVLWVWRGGSVAMASALTFGTFLFVNKVFSPQYMLWFLVFAILAQWPVWTYWTMAVAGLLDYVNSITILHFMYPHSPALSWYAYRLFPLGLVVRYLTLAAATGQALVQVWNQFFSESPPVTAKESLTG